MPPKSITGSPNITALDSKIHVSLCDGKIYIDATPSHFLGSGASNVLGVKVKVTNPYKTVVKDYTSSYDIAVPLTGIYEMSIPTKGGNFQFGIYTIELELTDADGTKHYVSKTVNVCAQPDAITECESAVTLLANCMEGKLYIFVAEPPMYQGKISEDRTSSWTVVYPSGSLPSETGTLTNFAVRLFEGVYKLTGSHCAKYNMGDNVYISLGYSGKWEKNVKCVLDYSCINPKLLNLQKKSLSNCSAKEKAENESRIFEALWLMKLIEITTTAGGDASEEISQLEELLGCSCTCNCAPGTPIVGNAPSSGAVGIQGVGVTSQTLGLITTYTINNYHYIIEASPNQNYITVSAPALTDGIYRQVISINAANLYQAIVGQIQTGGATTNNFFASVINNALVNVNPTCLGYTQNAWNALSLYQKIQAIADKACASACDATIYSHTTSRAGSRVNISWVHIDAYAVEVYIDDSMMGRVLAGSLQAFIDGMTDGLVHTYRLIPICSNGAFGTPVQSTFQYINCPSINPPAVSANAVNNATCPYSLTSLLTGVPVGITVEWHTANNTLASTLVANPAAVSSGVYFAFARNTDGCYSSATQVTLVCADTSCTAPQSLDVVDISGGVLVRFESAAFPPPSNSYTVLRRLRSQADSPGNYTTIGSPTWNSGTSRWEIADMSRVVNTLYVYRAQSNCSGGATPYVDYEFATILCPTLTYIPADSALTYQFLPVTGSNVTKYEVFLYDNTETTEIDMKTHLPAFSTTILGTFSYLTPNTSYRGRVRVTLNNGYFKDCPFTTGTTTASGNATINFTFNEVGAADGTLLINKNGSAEVTQTADGFGNFTAAHNDLIEVGLTGSNTFDKELIITDTTTGLPVHSSTGNDNLNASFSAVAGHNYTIAAEISDAA